MQALEKFLGNINQLIDKSSDGKEEYIHPKLKNLGSISLVLLREVIAPVVFRNAEEEITDIDIQQEPYIRAVPNKFKYPERGRGLQILRYYGVGGRFPQNKTVLRPKQSPSEAFDLNTLVFGDSANQDNRILPVKAAINYSDALSLQPKADCVEKSFHNRAMEDGTLFDAIEKKNSDNLFTRHFVKPGCFLIQVLSSRGKLLPKIGLDHLLLSLGIAGSHGGQTSVSGTNIRTHLVGIYADHFEKPETSPYELVKYITLQKMTDYSDLNNLITLIDKQLKPLHEVSIDHNTLKTYQEKIMQEFEKEGSNLQKEYLGAKEKVAELFDSWFGTGKGKK